MATFTKNFLTGSSNGKQILISSSSNGTAVTLHTTAAGTAYKDEVYLYAYNDDTVNRLLTVLWGGTTEPDNAMRFSLPPQTGRLCCVNGLPINNGLVIKAYADVASKVTVDGFVNNIA